MLKGEVDRIEELVRSSAVPKTTTDGCGDDTPSSVPNNTFGAGRIDALAMIQSYVLFRDGFESGTTGAWSLSFP